ncbi:hypothetical protein HHI36_022950 [Cryptolaemus montrouzieri]|uniref:Reverse transcriptase n=1 Tax=Cryptolaemus montrouzieri TaxID=559131 RepID=A0ABD2PEY1_9CUCU
MVLEGKKALDAILSSADWTLRCLDRGKLFFPLFLDLTKVYDCVAPPILWGFGANVWWKRPEIETNGRLACSRITDYNMAGMHLLDNSLFTSPKSTRHTQELQKVRIFNLIGTARDSTECLTLCYRALRCFQSHKRETERNMRTMMVHRKMTQNSLQRKGKNLGIGYRTISKEEPLV